MDHQPEQHEQRKPEEPLEPPVPPQQPVQAGEAAQTELCQDPDPTIAAGQAGESMQDDSVEESEEIYVTNPRRAPKYGRFMFIGAILGAIVGLLIIQFGPAEGVYAIGDVTAAMLLLTVPAGAVLGAVTALLLDQKSLKNSPNID
ncbi:hypothetical protein [Flaviflexus massiliensis]|uniref:hypothetical protein n=1 Tax=Flaviflexus massiliensis TaxID=1522309 RepID=UPI0006D566DA|nr:hypothetical protein [Flaviflexus massiliensis]